MNTWQRILLSGSVALIMIFATTAHALTNEEILAQLDALYKAVATVQAQIQQLSPAVPPATPSTPTPPALGTACVRLASNVSLGMRDTKTGGSVYLLQQFLRSTGDYTYPELTGYFGVATQSALQRFQTRAGIVSSGTAATTGYGAAGPRTRARIESESCGAALPTLPSIPTIPPLVSSAASCTINGSTIKSGGSIQLYSVSAAPTGQNCSAFAATRTCTNGVLSGTDVHKYSSCSSTQTRFCTVGSLTMAHNESRAFYDRASVASGDTCSAHTQTRKCTDGVISGSTSYSIASCEGPRACTLDNTTVSSGTSREFYLLQNIPSTELCSAYATSRSCLDGVLAGSASYKYASCAPVSSSSCSVDNVVLPTASSSVFYSSATAPAGATCASISQTRSCTNGALSGSASYNRASCLDTLSCTLDGTTLVHASSTLFYSVQTVPYGSTCSSVSQTRTCTNNSLSGSETYKYARCSVAPPTSCVLDGTIVASGSSGTFYKARSVASGSSCQAGTRTCTSGTLGGDASYLYATCEVSAGSGTTNTGTSPTTCPISASGTCN